MAGRHEPAAQPFPAFAPRLPAACHGVELFWIVVWRTVPRFALCGQPEEGVDARGQRHEALSDVAGAPHQVADETL